MDKPLAEHVVEELMQEAKFHAREQIDVTVWWCLVILKVNLMIKLVMRRHVLLLWEGMSRSVPELSLFNSSSLA